MIYVSVIIVVRNEETYIVDCIKSIEKQFEDNDSWELIVVDGLSEDKTKELAKNYLKDKKFKWIIVDNPGKILATGWNIGIKNAIGKYVVRPDAHGALHEGYIKYGLEVLEQKPDVAAVGGILETKAKGFWGNIIKEALSSRVGVGNSSFRTATQSGYYDTAVYALYRKEIFDKVGYFNEKLVRHQDNDMHRRIKEIGGKFYLDIRMKADYYCRDTVPKLLTQMFNIGRYLPDVMGDGSLSIRHFAPFIFYGIIFILIALGFIHHYFMDIALFIFLSYMSIIFIDSIYRAIKKRNIFILLNIFIIPLMHFFYGIGTLVGLIKKFRIGEK
jgi:glycosyltransferase involved in cell wall biosynthesis